jgi:hypothetical protein
MSIAQVFRVGLGLGTAIAVVAWYTANVLFLKVVLRWEMIDAVERLAYVCLFLALAFLVPLGGLGAWQAGARTTGQAAWAGAATGALAAVPAYVLVGSTVGAIYGIVVPLLATAHQGSQSQSTSHAVGSVLAGAMWATPLIAVGFGAVLTLVGAASGACFNWLAKRV